MGNIIPIHALKVFDWGSVSNGVLIEFIVDGVLCHALLSNVYREHIKNYPKMQVSLSEEWQEFCIDMKLVIPDCVNVAFYLDDETIRLNYGQFSTIDSTQNFINENKKHIKGFRFVGLKDRVKYSFQI